MRLFRTIKHETLAAMQRWDYKTVVLTGGFLGRHKEELKRADLEREFESCVGYQSPLA